MRPHPPRSTLFPYTTLFRSSDSFQESKRLPGPQWVVELIEGDHRSEEHTSELQSRFDLVCRLLLEKKKRRNKNCGSLTRHRRTTCGLSFTRVVRPRWRSDCG